jgi:hypothetical protein
MAEHLGVFREVVRRHPGARPAVLPHLHELQRFVTSPLFYYFCLRNPRRFRLWGSLLSDAAFFFEDLARSHSRFISSFPVEELIEGEASDVSRLDAADICARSSAWNDAAERALRAADTGNSLLTRSYSVERFDTSFVYYTTHFTFYASRWGATSEPFTRPFYHNLGLATQWSRAIGDADLVSECIVALLHSGSGADCGDLIDIVLGRQAANGAIVREPSMEARKTSDYEQLRHTTLVGLWAISEYAYANGIELSIALPDILGASYSPELSRSDKEELQWLTGLLSNYSGVNADEVSAQERTSAYRLAQQISGLRPFRCSEHYLKELEDSLPNIPSELSLPKLLAKTLLEMVGQSSCHACSNNLLHALHGVCGATRLQPWGDRDWLRQLLDDFLRLPIVRQRAG